MKIDRKKLRKRSSEVPTDCKALIDKLKSCSQDELLKELSKIKIWHCGKVELYHWIDILDEFDYILEVSCEKTKENQWCLPCDAPGSENKKQLVLCVLQFTALLIEHSFSRHFYNSMEHLTTLLSSSDIDVVLAVLNLLYVFSKTSNFITRLSADKRQTLLLRLLYLAESWGGKENGFGLAECCQNLPISAYPSSASTLHFEYYEESCGDKIHKQSKAIIAIHIDHVDKIPYKTPSEIMEELVDKYAVPEDKQMQLFTHIRLAYSFTNYNKRMLWVLARLQALSILVHCNAVPDNVNSILYNGVIEELVDVLKLQDKSLIEIKAAALRTLTSIILLDRKSNINEIIDATGAASYNGFLPVLARSCIQALTGAKLEPGSSAQKDVKQKVKDMTHKSARKVSEEHKILESDLYKTKYDNPLTTNAKLATREIYEESYNNKYKNDKRRKRREKIKDEEEKKSKRCTSVCTPFGPKTKLTAEDASNKRIETEFNIELETSSMKSRSFYDNISTSVKSKVRDTTASSNTAIYNKKDSVFPKANKSITTQDPLEHILSPSDEEPPLSIGETSTEAFNISHARSGDLQSHSLFESRSIHRPGPEELLSLEGAKLEPGSSAQKDVKQKVKDMTHKSARKVSEEHKILESDLYKTKYDNPLTTNAKLATREIYEESYNNKYKNDKRRKRREKIKDEEEKKSKRCTSVCTPFGPKTKLTAEDASNKRIETEFNIELETSSMKSRSFYDNISTSVKSKVRDTTASSNTAIYNKKDSVFPKANKSITTQDPLEHILSPSDEEPPLSIGETSTEAFNISHARSGDLQSHSLFESRSIHRPGPEELLSLEGAKLEPGSSAQKDVKQKVKDMTHKSARKVSEEHKILESDLYKTKYDNPLTTNAKLATREIYEESYNNKYKNDKRRKRREKIKDEEEKKSKRCTSVCTPFGPKTKLTAEDASNKRIETEFNIELETSSMKSRSFYDNISTSVKSKVRDTTASSNTAIYNKKDSVFPKANKSITTQDPLEHILSPSDEEPPLSIGETSTEAFNISHARSGDLQSHSLFESRSIHRPGPEELLSLEELSLKEPGSSPEGSSSLYNDGKERSNCKSIQKEPRKVKALYYFKGLCEDELSFKAGDIVSVLDDTRTYWWIGIIDGRQGIFPASHVTANLSYEPEQRGKVEEKTSVKFNEDFKFKTLKEQEEVYIDEVSEENLPEKKPDSEEPLNLGFPEDDDNSAHREEPSTTKLQPKIPKSRSTTKVQKSKLIKKTLYFEQKGIMKEKQKRKENREKAKIFSKKLAKAAAQGIVSYGLHVRILDKATL